MGAHLHRPEVAAAQRQLQLSLTRADGRLDGIDRLSGAPVFIYGAGNYGRIVYRLLNGNGIPAGAITGFLDAGANGAEVLGLPVRHPDDPSISFRQRGETEVVIAIYCSLAQQQEIRQYLLGLGYAKVRSCYETAISFHSANDPACRISGSGFFPAHLDRILAGCTLWEDQRSLETYLNHFLGYATCDPERFLLETDHRQYLPPAPLVGKGHARFIDCGAFDGDTVRDLNAHTGKLESLVLFEPCEGNFARLNSYVRSCRESIADRVTLFPCGVWDRTTQLRFDKESAAASSVSQRGEEVVQCVALDDVLHGAAPTCIKMDIEGAEPNALRGAEATIREHRPDLAICVYHSLSHFWELPELVREWVPEYRFYLRTYAAAGFETVMYAVAGA